MRPKNSKFVGAGLIVIAVVIVPVLIAGYSLREHLTANRELTAAEHASTVRANKLTTAFSGGPIAAMAKDPAFAKLSEPQKYDNVIVILERLNPDFAKEDPAFKYEVATKLLQEYGQLYSGGVVDPLAGSKPVNPAEESLQADRDEGKENFAVGTVAALVLGCLASGVLILILRDR